MISLIQNKILFILIYIVFIVFIFLDMNCNKCGHQFSRLDSKRRHEESCTKLSDDISKTCGKCSKVFTRSGNRARHEEVCGQIYSGTCIYCNQEFTSLHNHLRHERFCNKPPQAKKRRRIVEPNRDLLLASKPDTEGVSEYETAFQNRLKSYFIRSDDNLDMTTFCNSVKEKILNRLMKSLQEQKAIKYNIFVDCLMKNLSGEELDAAVKTKNIVIVQDTDVSNTLDEAFKVLERELEEVELKKSGWALYAIDGLRLRVNKYRPLSGSTYIPLPQKIANKKACINVENDDTECFRYAILAKFVSEKAHRQAMYNNIQHQYDFRCITFPTSLEDV